MKKIFFKNLLVFLMCSLVFCGCVNTKDTGVLVNGMSIYDVIEIEKSGDVVAVYEIKFCKNENGDSVIGYLGEDNILTGLKVYRKAEPTPRNFSKIKLGMSIYEVVKYIGIPKPQILSAFGVEYRLTDGTGYTLLLHGEGENVVVTCISRHPD